MTTVRIAKATIHTADFGEVISTEHMWAMSLNGGDWMFTISRGMWDFLAACADCPDVITVQLVAPICRTVELNPKGAI